MIDKKKVRSLLQITGSIIGLILIMIQIKNGISGFNENQVEFLNVRFLLFSLLFATTALFFQILGWNKINKTVEYDIPLRNVLFGYTFTFLPRYIPGTIWGYLTRSEWLLKIHQIPYKDSMFVSLMEMIIIFFTNLTLGSYLIFYSTNDLLLSFLPIFILFLSILFINLLSKRFIIINILINNKLRKINLSSWLILLFIFFSSWLLYGIGLLYTIQAFTSISEINPSFILLVTSIQSISWVVGFIIVFIPAGLGIRETILNYLLLNFIFLPVALSSVISITFRLITLMAELILLVTSYFFQKKVKKKLIME
jgi:hypothetical protein